MRSRVVLGVLLFFSIGVGSVYSSSLSIFFGNGVHTTEEDAERALDAVRTAVLNDPFFAGEDLSFDLAYNNTKCPNETQDGDDDDYCIGDFYESAKQLVLPVGSRISDTEFWLFVALQRETPADKFNAFSQLAVTTPAFSSPSSFFEADLSKQVAVYQDHIHEKGRKVLLVAHSQGNFFGNDVFQLLSSVERANFGMVSVATPDDRVLGDLNPRTAPYTTLAEDPIHKVPDSFDSNLSNFGVFLGEPENRYHSFVKWYMRPLSLSREVIKGNIRRVASFLTNGAPGFTTIADMTVPRQFHCAVKLSDGRVLVAGGTSPNRTTPLNSAEIYDPVTRTFSPTGSMNTARGRGLSCVRLTDGRVLVAGGAIGPFTYTDSAEVYNPVSGTFTQAGSMTTPRGEGWQALTQGDGALLFGGTFEGVLGTGSANVDRFNSDTETFTQVGSLLGARRDFTAQKLSDGSVLLVGGVARFDLQASPLAERYDTTTNQSSTTGQPSGTPRTRTWGSALLPDGRVFIATGVGLPAEIYNPTTNSFEAVPGSPNFFAGDFAYTVSLSDGRVLLLGYGRNSGDGGRLGEIYNPATGGFTSAGPFALPGPCEGYVATPLNDGTVLITGGGSQGSCASVPTAEVFNPRGL